MTGAEGQSVTFGAAGVQPWIELSGLYRSVTRSLFATAGAGATLSTFDWSSPPICRLRASPRTRVEAEAGEAKAARAARRARSGTERRSEVMRPSSSGGAD